MKRTLLLALCSSFVLAIPAQSDVIPVGGILLNCNVSYQHPDTHGQARVPDDASSQAPAQAIALQRAREAIAAQKASAIYCPADCPILTSGETGVDYDSKGSPVSLHLAHVRWWVMCTGKNSTVQLDNQTIAQKYAEVGVRRQTDKKISYSYEPGNQVNFSVEELMPQPSGVTELQPAGAVAPRTRR